VGILWGHYPVLTLVDTLSALFYLVAAHRAMMIPSRGRDSTSSLAASLFN